MLYKVYKQEQLISATCMIELCGITVLFGIYKETNKHQNLSRLRCPIGPLHMEVCAGIKSTLHALDVYLPAVKSK